ncbi:MAG: hypothetical protein HC803_02180, partial [Saprospiraceae bacterium]|nr:hypothetical protein [Saprospiraceae bacterium]
ASGTGSLEYSINGGTSWQPSNVFSNLSAGTYQIRVRNINGTCMVSATDEVLTAPQLPVITDVTSQNPSDCGLNNGTITVTATGTSIQYSINGGLTWVSNGGSFTNLGSGTYYVAVRNSDGTCVVQYNTNPIVLTAPAAPSITNVASNNPTNCGVMMELSLSQRLADKHSR